MPISSHQSGGLRVSPARPSDRIGRRECRASPQLGASSKSYALRAIPHVALTCLVHRPRHLSPASSSAGIDSLTPRRRRRCCRGLPPKRVTVGLDGARGSRIELGGSGIQVPDAVNPCALPVANSARDGEAVRTGACIGCTKCLGCHMQPLTLLSPSRSPAHIWCQTFTCAPSSSSSFIIILRSRPLCMRRLDWKLAGRVVLQVELLHSSNSQL
ncbi:hypothetical protein B0H15DRAFT_491212 [Mycena belliarum]|uniref:Uncharacterized protein n=1 Tax=Mycena belliarum TaxID=1033014 RepID=A0AAD6TXQ0_9AGAR|nr:hypothetical protein B0H15DRAFT_491212 [Mycena belliae]